MGLWPNAEGAQRFADALNTLIRAARGVGDTVSASDWNDFVLKANKWRAMPVKPDLPEEAQRHRVLAEHAISEKDFDKAIEEYDAALDVFPTWPDGQYNVAALCAGIEDYQEAIQHMKYYLELLPDAPDAKEARQQIWIWQDKAKATH
jgi:tetratricopeptide (TPR) repeat protein